LSFHLPRVFPSWRFCLLILFLPFFQATDNRDAPFGRNTSSFSFSPSSCSPPRSFFLSFFLSADPASVFFFFFFFFLGFLWGFGFFFLFFFLVVFWGVFLGGGGWGWGVMVRQPLCFSWPPRAGLIASLALPGFQFRRFLFLSVMSLAVLFRQKVSRPFFLDLSFCPFDRREFPRRRPSRFTCTKTVAFFQPLFRDPIFSCGAPQHNDHLRFSCPFFLASSSGPGVLLAGFFPLAPLLQTYSTSTSPLLGFSHRSPS